MARFSYLPLKKIHYTLMNYREWEANNIIIFILWISWMGLGCPREFTVNTLGTTVLVEQPKRLCNRVTSKEESDRQCSLVISSQIITLWRPSFSMLSYPSQFWAWEERIINSSMLIYYRVSLTDSNFFTSSCVRKCIKVSFPCFLAIYCLGF